MLSSFQRQHHPSESTRSCLRSQRGSVGMMGVPSFCFALVHPNALSHPPEFYFAILFDALTFLFSLLDLIRCTPINCLEIKAFNKSDTRRLTACLAVIAFTTCQHTPRTPCSYLSPRKSTPSKPGPQPAKFLYHLS